MSAVTESAARQLPERESLPGRHLRAVDAPRRGRRPRRAYAMIAVAAALSIGAAQMILSIATTQDSYALSTLRQQQRELTWQKQALYDDVAGLSSPQFLAANAAALGMVINTSPSYLRLSDGKILGTGESASAASTVDAIGRGAVPNELVADTPLVTDPDATIKGAPLKVESADTGTGALPPPITDGLPTPKTR